MLVTEPAARLLEVVAEAVIGGVNVVQWRDKQTAPEELHRQAPALLRAASPALVIVNGPPAMGKADGRHLPGESSSVRFLRHAYPKIIGRSVHSIGEAEQASREGADYLVAGTIFASQSHPDIAPAGVEFLREVCEVVPIPVLAIGGVTPGRVRDCIAAGAAGVAVLSPIMRAADPRGVAQGYRAALDAAWEEQTCR